MYSTFRIQATAATFKLLSDPLHLTSLHLLNEDFWKNTVIGTIGDSHLPTLVDRIQGLGCIQVQTPTGEWTALYGAATSVKLLEDWGKRDIPMVTASVAETVEAFHALHAPAPVESAQQSL